MSFQKNYNEYFSICLELAKKSFLKNEVPVGCVIVKNGVIISKGYNNRQNSFSVLGHAEIVAIQKVEKKIKDWRLDGCELFVNLEPCELCKTVINESRIDKVYYLNKNNHSIKKMDNEIIYSNQELSKISEELIKKFFINLRN